MKKLYKIANQDVTKRVDSQINSMGGCSCPCIWSPRSKMGANNKSSIRG